MDKSMLWSKYRRVIKRAAICAAVLVLVAGGAAYGYHDMQEAKAQREEDYQNGIAAIASEEYEQERISEEEERQREKEMRKNLADEIPYEGMSEDYIDLTAVGKHGKYSTSDFKISGRTIYEHKYVWYSSNGKDVPLIVICRDGRVYKVIKYFVDTYWNSDGSPNFGAARKAGNSSSSSKTQYHDSYNEGYDDVYSDGDYDLDRYQSDGGYANDVDDALDDWDEYGDDW